MVLCELSKKTCCSPSAGIRPLKIPAVSAAWEDPVAYKQLMKEREEAEKSFEVWPLVLDLQRLLCAPPSSYVACFLGGTQPLSTAHREFPERAQELKKRRRLIAAAEETLVE